MMAVIIASRQSLVVGRRRNQFTSVKGLPPAEDFRAILRNHGLGVRFESILGSGLGSGCLKDNQKGEISL